MIKINTLGMLDSAKVNPMLKLESDVSNYSIHTVDDDLYIIANTITGDKVYTEDAVIAAGEYLNGFLVKAWEGQKLIVDGKHIEGELSSLNAGDALTAQASGKLKKATKGEGVHFVVTDKGVTLTEAAIKVKVVVADATATA